MYRFLIVFCLLAISACTPSEQDFAARNKPPVLKDKCIQTGDLADLPLRKWLPDKKVQAVVLAIHGFNDYSNGFDAAGTYFAEHGIAIYAYDQRGFGKAPHWTTWPGEANLTADVIDAVKALHVFYPGTPLYIMGESMGAAVTILTLARHEVPEVQGAVLVSPAVWGDDAMPFYYKGGLWFAAHTVPQMRVSGKGLNRWPSDNIEMLRALGRDPLIIKHTRIDAIYGLVHLMGNARREISKVQTPMLVLYGENDQIVPPPAMASLDDLIKAPHRMIHYNTGYHMLLRDLKGERVMKDVVKWIEDSDKASHAD
ncbi:MAG: alpha/beta hydrolase [Rickettsiales bacterium]